MLASGITLYFARHGETDWNFAKRYQGQTDIPLNTTGQLQAARNGRALASELGERATALDYVASPLGRACETMQIMRRELGLPELGYRTDDRLKEINFGHWEGQLWDELPTIDGEGFAARKADPWSWLPRGGESYRLLSERVAGWLAEVERDTVVVAHGGVMRVLRGLTLQLNSAEIPILDAPQDRMLAIARACMRWI